ncbi:glycerophosphodiester phosphodiesterase [Arthrobacter sp. MSA 4-2]|uniref:glycerophosphodiester phosphodiesterase n=1 Tax=Arthrobacter sp. MSA 4-2 TaxID=2794349 RepID=UPI0018E8FB86|nr:glycerophosphodiester phosphodiesterase family protein [Arthrobacter sp. MSA 4-2]MBJ2120735.1 glycerophosphodiester phosphodiesterase [Arthrobacter sp. MSA 4-2]
MSPQIFAHRGASGSYAEHTRAAFLQALADGVDGVECDVHLTRDEQLVCIHDPTLERTSNGSGDVADHTLAQLRELDFSSWKGVRIPAEYGGPRNQLLTLADLLRLLRSAGRSIALAIELKHPSPFGLRLEAELVAFLLDEGWDPESSTLGNLTISFMSFNPDSMHQLGEIAPAHALCQLVADVEPDEVREALSFGSITSGAVVNLMRRAIDEGEALIDAHTVGIAGPGVAYVRAHQDIVRRWVSEGVRVRVWTVNTQAEAELVAGLGVQEITTDYPAEMRSFFAISSGG